MGPESARACQDHPSGPPQQWHETGQGHSARSQRSRVGLKQQLPPPPAGTSGDHLLALLGLTPVTLGWFLLGVVSTTGAAALCMLPWRKVPLKPLSPVQTWLGSGVVVQPPLPVPEPVTLQPPWQRAARTDLC